jgi:excisionase family DNA binding protein
MATNEPDSAATSPTHEVLTLAEAAAYLRILEDALEKLAAERAIPARKIGDEWRFSRTALHDWLRCVPAADEPWFHAGAGSAEPSAPRRVSRQRLLELSGAWKDDPTVDEMLRQIYKERGRPMIDEDG